MHNRIRRILPWLSLASGLIAILCLSLLTSRIQARVSDSPSSRREAQDVMTKLQVMHPVSIDDGTFFSAVEKVPGNSNVATIWLVDPDGNVIFSSGSTATSLAQGTVWEEATSATRSVLEAVPEDALNLEQRTLLLASSAIQAEGEHNDIYRHLVGEIRSPDDSVIAIIGLAYHINPDEADATWIALVIGGFLSLGIFWLALPTWVFFDARGRGERAWVWAVYVLIGNLVALIAYILARVPISEPSMDER